MFIDIYALQNVPPSNINRDDTGSPKTALYGGFQRARVSSQAWKHAMRQEFLHLLPANMLGVRTKHIVGLIEERICRQRPDLKDQARTLVEAMLAVPGIKTEMKKGKKGEKKTENTGNDKGTLVTGYLVFVCEMTLDGLAELAIVWADESVNLKKLPQEQKDKVIKIFQNIKAVDVALFGRMLADAKELGVDASAQVAHAISVDRVTQEYDYYTALDDRLPEDDQGAAMIGTVCYQSATLYRYANINLDSLHAQLGDVQRTIQGVSAFVDAFARVMPHGKQNTFANGTLPKAFLVSFHQKQPLNVVSAFEVPVKASEEKSISSQAIIRLAREIATFESEYDMTAREAWSTVADTDQEVSHELSSISTTVTFDDLLSNVQQEVTRLLTSKEE